MQKTNWYGNASVVHSGWGPDRVLHPKTMHRVSHCTSAYMYWMQMILETWQHSSPINMPITRAVSRLILHLWVTVSLTRQPRWWPIQYASTCKLPPAISSFKWSETFQHFYFMWPNRVFINICMWVQTRYLNSQTIQVNWWDSMIIG